MPCSEHFLKSYKLFSVKLVLLNMSQCLFCQSDHVRVECNMNTWTFMVFFTENYGACHSHFFFPNSSKPSHSHNSSHPAQSKPHENTPCSCSFPYAGKCFLMVFNPLSVEKSMWKLVAMALCKCWLTGFGGNNNKMLPPVNSCWNEDNPRRTLFV